jgi:glycosyltransferase involved in cell wall biosynthesis
MGTVMKKKVSCHVITYNHINYISQCIEGILMQKTDFEFEIIIGDDLSTDGTREILEDYAIQNPKLIKLNLRNERGQGIPGKENFVSTLQMCKGEYITLCDGDDYWTDPFKLQKQVDFLEANSEYVIHSAVARVLSNNEITDDYVGLESEPKTFTIDNFYKQNNLISCTVIFKNIITEFPTDFHKIIFGDWYLYTLLLKKSGLKAYRSKDIFSIYRIHSSGVMKSLSLRRNYEVHIQQIIMLKRLIGYRKFPKDVIGLLNWYSFEKFKIELDQKKYLQMMTTFLYNFYLVKFNIPFKNYLRTIKQNVIN